jgi:uncharacterized protein
MTIQELKDKNLILLECISGSKAYGLSTPSSDTDIKGVFYLPKERFYGLDQTSQVSNETNDEVYYEVGKFTELLLKNNPNILELLATPQSSVIFRHPVMEYFKIEDFLSRLCKETFAGYAITQVRKARGYNKKIVNPVEKERKSVLDFCFITEGYTSIPLKQWLHKKNYLQENCGLAAIPHMKGLYALFYDASETRGYKGIISSENSNEVSTSSIMKDEKQLAYMFFGVEGYSAYCKSYREYWDWVEKRNEERYSGNMAHGKNYDSKNLMHTIRLLQVALEILQEGRLNVHRQNREELLAIKEGKFTYDELIGKADDLMTEIEFAYVKSKLQDEPDRVKCESLLVTVREQLYK